MPATFDKMIKAERDETLKSLERAGAVIVAAIALRHGRLKVPLLTLVKATNRVPLQFLDRRS